MLCIVWLTGALWAGESHASAGHNDGRILSDTTRKVSRSEAEWKAQLSPAAYTVLRQKGTERPFTGKFVHNKAKGTYVCAGCRNPVFQSKTKFESGTGWPSFYAPADKKNVEEHQDRSHRMVRTEVLCSRCGGHLGHVFDDGPQPTGLRYCINSVSLDFVPEKSR